MRIVLRLLGIVAFIVTVVALLPACGTDAAVVAADKPGTGPFGMRCHGPGDCLSGECVRIDDAEGVCTQDCVADSDCPGADNWRCVNASAGRRVCACRLVDPHECGDHIDNDCNGRHDDCNTCDGKLTPKDDPQNCGTCGTKCRDDQSCTAGACRCTATGASDCGGTCVDAKSDPKNCGTCGTTCRADQRCVGGVCACSGSKPDECPNAGCVDTKTDATHCGGCGKTCSFSQTCQNGACACPAATPADCGGDAGCRDTQSDPSHCGACGHACPTGATCNNGQCSCPSGKNDVCSDHCVSVASDTQNCGACGHACTSGQYCSGGRCTCYSSGTTICDGQCISTSSDPNNCGGCGRKCRTGEVCSGGYCSCQSGLVCNDVCAPVNDSANCGGCGRACGSSQYCSYGTCYCYGGKTACGTSCADLYSDAAHCGSCANACSPTQQCLYGSCTCSVAGQGYCASAGGCIDLRSNDKNCGACDKACPAEAHCTSGSCVCSVPGTTLCGASCSDLQKDAAHCGSCNVACDAGLTCSSGKCRCPAPTPGAEVRVTTTAALNPAVAWNGTYFGVAYLDTSNRTYSYGGNVKFTLLKADGTRALATDIALTAFVGNGSYPTVDSAPDVVWNGSEWAVVWTQAAHRPGDSVNWYIDTMLMRLAASGTSLGPAVDVTAATPGAQRLSGPVRIAYSAAGGGYALAAYTRTSSGVDFQRIGATGASPSAINHVDAASSYSATRLGFAASADGHWGVLSRNVGQLAFTEFNPDGSRTKIPVIVETAATDADPDLAYDGTSWVGTWVVAPGATGGSIVAARGVALGAKYYVASLATQRPVAARLSVSAGTATFVWSEFQTPTSFELEFARARLPAGTASLVVVTDATPLVTTPTEGPDSMNYAMATAGSNGFITAWGDTRWGASELYAIWTNLHNCN